MENRRGELTDLLLREGGVGGRKGNLCSGQESRVWGVTENLPISHYLGFKLKNEVSSVSILPFASMGSIKLSWASKHAVG